MRLAPLAVDNHGHVLDPQRPPVPGARYAPPFEASVQGYDEHLAGLGVRRGVLITASTHGTDNVPMLHALRTSRYDLRGIAVVDPEVDDHELEVLHRAGVRGLRVQDRFPGGAPLTALVPLGDRVAGLGWHLEVWTDLTDHLDGLPGAIRRCRAPVVLDHLGYFSQDAPHDDRAVETMIDLARSGDAWITASGAYRLAPDTPSSRAGRHLAPRVHRLLEAVPDRLLWGTDWPHVAPPGDTPHAGRSARRARGVVRGRPGPPGQSHRAQQHCLLRLPIPDADGAPFSYLTRRPQPFARPGDDARRQHGVITRRSRARGPAPGEGPPARAPRQRSRRATAAG